jgi:N-hydroxyarylamine O-acetyltransferase
METSDVRAYLYRIGAFMDGEPQYRLEPRGRELGDYEASCWWHQTSPKSQFTQSIVCSRLTETGRVSLAERTLIEADGTERRERTLSTDAEVLAAYQAYFDISLDRVPELNRYRPAGRL